MISKSVHVVAGLLSAWAGAGLAGCGSSLAAPVAITLAGVQPGLDTRELAAVLHACVRQGSLIETALRKDAARLDVFLARQVVTGPTVTPRLFPTPESRLAYWYNARAAWSLKLALLANCRETIRPAELEDRRFRLDGRTMTLAGIDHALAGDPDWPVAVSAPSIRQHEPGLPDGPFDASTVRAQIEQRFQEYLADTDRFEIDLPSHEVIFPAALWAVRETLVRQYERKLGGKGATPITALLPYARGRGKHRLQDAIGFQVVPPRGTGLIALLLED